MADKTRKAVIDALHRAYMDHEDFKMTTDLLESLADAAIATLHHAEAGAVAWTYRDLDDPSRVIARTANEFGGNIDLYPDKWKRERPLIYGDTPAQAASQETHPAAALDREKNDGR